MTYSDVIAGMGEVGRTIHDLLEKRGYSCFGFDVDAVKIPNGNVLHICFPFGSNFEDSVIKYNEFVKPKTIIIHSSIRPKTTKSIQDKINIPVIYSPVRGVHSRFLDDMIRYTKFYACGIEINHNIFAKRFRKIQYVEDTTALETTKLIETTYYGWLIIFRKMVDNKFDVYWDFMTEINDFLKNRPVMYNNKKKIGGHCVIPNLDLLDDNEFSQLIRKHGGVDA